MDALHLTAFAPTSATQGGRRSASHCRNQTREFLQTLFSKRVGALPSRLGRISEVGLHSRESRDYSVSVQPHHLY